MERGNFVPHIAKAKREDARRKPSGPYLLPTLDRTLHSQAYAKGSDAQSSSGRDGLLRTEQHLQKLKTAIVRGKKLWMDMDLSTWQPKWHMTFDSHPYNQVVKFGGLADKTDEYIEKAYQYWKIYEGWHCRITNFKLQQLAIRSAERQSRHPRVALHLR